MLSSSRPSSMGGVGAIPFEAIDRYAERYDVDDFEEFASLVYAMDAVFMQHINAPRTNGRGTKDGPSDRD